MAEIISKEFKILIQYDKDANSFHSQITTPSDVGPEFIWEVLKLGVVNMVKAAPYYADPIVRENIELAAKSMRVTVLGTDAAIAKLRSNQQAINKELQP